MSSLPEQELLALSDQDLFCGGGCHVFADELYRQLAYNGFELRRIAEGQLFRFQAYHVDVAKGDTAVDCEGIKSESGMLSDYVESRRKNRYPLTEDKAFPCEQKSLFEVCDNTDDHEPHNCWYHRIGSDFVQECRRRARAMIASTPEKYFIAPRPNQSLQPTASRRITQLSDS